MNFTRKIVIEYDRRRFRLVVQLLEKNAAMEKYMIIARNKTLVLQNNRPLLHAKRLKNWQPEWKLLEGKLSNSAVREKIQQEIERLF